MAWSSAVSRLSASVRDMPKVCCPRINKSDVHDAEGLAQLARTGWYKRVHMKGSATHIDRAALRIRSQLITARTAMANQLRGLLKLFGLRIGTARTPGRRAERLAAFYAQRPDLKALFARSSRRWKASRNSCA
jgi:transposase